MFAKLKKDDIIKSLKKNWKTGVCVVAALLLALALISYFVKGTEEKETFNNKSTLRMFYVNWCPHCKDAKPEFKSCQNPDVIFEAVDCEAEENKNLVTEFKPEGYPTYVFTRNGANIPYEGGRSKAEIESWLENQMQN